MPILDWKLKDCTETQQEIFLRTDTTGTATVTASNGQTASVSLDTSIDDGTGTVTVTGVTDGMGFTVYLDDVEQDTGRFNLAPAQGDRFTICGLSCMYNILQKDIQAARHMAYEPRLKLVCDQGDTTYMNSSSSTAWGVTTAQTYADKATAQDVDTYRTQHLQALRWPALQLLGHTAMYIDGWDDHEGPTDDFSHLYTDANAELTGASAGYTYTNQADCDTAFIAAQTAYREYCKGNPSWATPINQKPPDSSLTDNDYFVNYSSKEFGSVLVLNLDCLTSRGRVGSDVSILNSDQWAQMQADVAASSLPFVLVNSSKGIMQSTNGNIDGFSTSAATEEAAILTWMDSVKDTGKGIIWMTGDDHLAMWSESSSPDATCVYGCSISQDIKTNRVANSYTKLLYPDFSNNYWKIDVHGDSKIVVSLVNVFGDEKTLGTLYPGSAKLV